MPLHLAAQYGNVSVVRYIARVVTDPEHIRLCEHRCPLPYPSCIEPYNQKRQTPFDIALIQSATSTRHAVCCLILAHRAGWTFEHLIDRAPHLKELELQRKRVCENIVLFHLMFRHGLLGAHFERAILLKICHDAFERRYEMSI
jgi:hypothetical protein